MRLTNLKYLGLAIGVLAVLFVSGCTEQISFECDYMSLGWLSEFAGKYYVMPEEAVQCDSREGSFIMISFGSEMAKDVGAVMSDELLGLAIEGGKDYYDEICTASKSFCAQGLVASEGKINTAQVMEGNKVALIVVNSEDPTDAEAFLEGVWQNRNPSLS